ncbi:MAG TPA: hypothetical protein VJS64_03440, partial [Pyrinomonadaceae bacterium]|nr:hypothetical protein [Pyrinomonadaceae bacterium]
RPVDWRLLGGGLAFGATILAIGLGNLPYSQEVVLAISLAVIAGMLVFVTREFGSETRRALFSTAAIVFAYRATPVVGDGYFWWTLDALRFDAEFYGILNQTSGVIGFVALWLFAKQLTQYSIARTLLWLSIIGLLLWAPAVGLYYGVHQWTESTFGLGARWIAFIDAAATSPFSQLSMIPLLALIAYYAPPGHRATWFALMTSLMNLALVASQLATKYLNLLFPIERGAYNELGNLLLVVAGSGFLIPVAAILLLSRRF